MCRYALVVGLFSGAPVLGQGLDESVNPFDMGVTSPTAAGIGEAALADISLETGAVQVNIPLFEITSRSGLSVPVTLSYQSNGVRMNDIATWVGLGWTLHAGGAITRTVRGIPDEGSAPGRSDGYPFTRHRIENMNTWEQIPTDILWGMFRDTLDTQPDLFTYANPNHSGSFIWYGVDTFLTVPKVPLDLSGHPNTGWTLLDADGVTYQYAVSERTNTVTFPSFQTYLSSWYLTSMSDTEEEILLSYRTEPQNPSFDTSFALEIIEVHSDSNPTFCQGISTGPSPPPVQSRSTIETHRTLETIRSNDMLAVFHSAPGPYPLDESPQGGAMGDPLVKLDSIQVFSLPDSVLVRSFHFEYTYYTTQANGFLNRKTNHLFLTAVTEVGHDGEALPPHQFQYIDPTQLPGRMTQTRQNAWGFAGITGGSPETMANGLLERIDYPTGGWETITYEYNRLPSVGGPGGGLVPAFGGYTSIEAIYPGGPLQVSDTFETTTGDASWTPVHFTYVLNPDPATLVSHYIEIDCGDDYQSGIERNSGTVSVPLDEGTECTIMASAEISGPDPHTATLTAEWSVWVPPTPGVSYGDIAGGLRVRARRSYPADGSDPLIREFFYVKDDGVTSSGIGREGSFHMAVGGICTGYIEAVSAVSTVGSTDDVTYTRVVVRDSGTDVWGETAYLFHQIQNHPAGGTAGVYIPGALTNYDWLSHPMGHIVYDADGEPVMSSTSGYSPPPTGQPGAPIFAPAFTARIFHVGGNVFFVPYETRYYVISGWNRVIVTEEIHYDVD